jgi:hypothetical protein
VLKEGYLNQNSNHAIIMVLLQSVTYPIEQVIFDISSNLFTAQMGQDAEMYNLSA